MKNLFVLLVCCSMFSQSKSYLSMSPDVVPIVENFIKDGKERGFYLRHYLISKVDLIIFSDNLGRKLGVTDKFSKIIYLSPRITEDKILFKLTVYHEIGHLLKFTGEHSCFNCYDIMTEYAPLDLSPYNDETFFKEKIDDYFEWLNNK